jgi:WD40 repeat protein
MPWPLGRLALLAAVLLAPPARAEAPKPRLDAHGDTLPDGALTRIGTLRLRHPGPATNVVFAPDGKSLASCGHDSLIRLWDAATGKEIRRFEGHKDDVDGLAFSPDGKTLLSTGSCGTARLWDVATGKERLALRLPPGVINAAAFSPDGKKVATKCYCDGSVRLWDAVSGQELHHFSGAHNPGTSNLAFTRDGKALAMVSHDNNLVFYDTTTFKEVNRFRGHNSSVNSLDFSADGKVLASAGSDAVVRLWDVATCKELRALRGHERNVTCVRLSPDGKTAATASHDDTVRLWDVATGKELRRCAGHTGVVSAVAYSPDGKELASASWDHTVRLWDPATGKELPQSAGPDPITYAALSADGRLLVTAGRGDDLHLWEPATGKPLARARLEFAGAVTALALSADGRLIAAGNTRGDLALWESATGKRRFTVTDAGAQPGPAAAVMALAFLPDGRALAAVRGISGAGIDVYDAAMGRRQPSSLPGDERAGISSTIHLPPDALFFAPEGDLCVTNSPTDGTAVMHFATGRVLRRLKGANNADVSGLALSPDGRTIATTGTGKSVRLWETTTGGVRCQFGPVNETASAAAFSPDGRLLAAAGKKGVVHVLQLPVGRELRSFSGHTGLVHALAFAADGKLLSVSMDGTALVWDTSDLKPKAPERPGKIDAEAAWNALAAEDAARSYEMMTRLGESPAATVDLLRQRLKPADGADAKRIAQLIAQLDDDDFDKRQEASRELAKFGARAEGALREAARAASAEAMRRAEDLLKKLEEGGALGERLRQSRALEVMEGIGTTEAKQLLEELAKGAPNAVLTREAKASLGRLGMRP